MRLFPLIFVALMLLVGGLVWYFSKQQRYKRAVTKVPVTPIGDLPHGASIEGIGVNPGADPTSASNDWVRVVGTAHIIQECHAPFTGRSCAFWQVLVQEKRGSGKNSSWHTLVEETGGHNFVVTDDSGAAKVNTSGVSALLDKDSKRSSGMFNSPPESFTQFLAERGHSSKFWIFNKTLRFHEGIIEDGEPVTVVGQCRLATRERDADVGTPRFEHPTVTLEMPRAGDRMLLLSDLRSLTRR